MLFAHLLLLLAATSLPVLAADTCEPERLPAGKRAIGKWITADNWLAPGNQRASLSMAEVFMPRIRLRASSTAVPMRPATRLLDLDKLTLADPVDEKVQSIASLLDSRLYADAILVVHNGRILAERQWHGAHAEQPRLLLQTGRPILSLLGAMSIAQGKLAPERSVVRYVPALSTNVGLRRLSVQRLLEGDDRYAWSPEELAQWRSAGGWGNGPNSAGVRDWLSQPERWERPLHETLPEAAEGGPDDDLLAWVLAESHGAPLSKVFCEQLLLRMRPEQPAAWLTDPAGNELAGGLVLSLRDFARLGQLLIEARTSPTRSRIPGWFVETLTASGSSRAAAAVALSGLRKGSDLRYGFVRLGGAANRVAILGAHGTSLYIDFDRRLVVALYATHPQVRSALQLASLERLWDALGAAVPAVQKR
jgi:CubicO group peptidase (beta-lactamase class C family)